MRIFTFNPTGSPGSPDGTGLFTFRNIVRALGWKRCLGLLLIVSLLLALAVVALAAFAVVAAVAIGAAVIFRVGLWIAGLINGGSTTTLPAPLPDDGRRNVRVVVREDAEVG